MLLLLLLALPALALPPPLVAPLGTDRLAEIGELRFTVVHAEDGATETHGWVWEPPTGRVTRIGADDSLSFALGRPQNDAERAADQQFLRDTFWLAPQLHVGWAAGHAALVDHGPATFAGQPVRRIELRYSPTAGGYTPGDAHDLYTDAEGRIVGWSYRPAGGAVPTVTVAFEDWVAVGPLALATVRRTADGAVPVSFRDLAWVPAGVVISVVPGADAGFLRLDPVGCTLGSEVVGRRIASAAGPRAGSRTRDLAEGERDLPTFAEVLSVRDGAAGAALHRWSSDDLALEDAGWLASSGVLSCDFGALGVPELRAVLDRASPAERGAVLTLLLEWTLSEVPLPAGSGPFLRRVRGAARSCAATGRCELLYAWVGRRR